MYVRLVGKHTVALQNKFCKRWLKELTVQQVMKEIEDQRKAQGIPDAGA